MPDLTPPDAPTFTSLGLDPRITTALSYTLPTPIQLQSIPVVLAGRDLVGLAGTGTGKTAAFALPTLHQLVHREAKGFSVLMLAPTRELAIQVAKAVKQYGKPLGIDVTAIYGGTDYGGQIRAIARGVHVVVATPGRALDLFRKGKLPLASVKTLVVDEADEMLDMGFAEDLDAILAETPKDRQTLLFSATMPQRIEEMAHRHLRNPVRIQVAAPVVAAGAAQQVRHTAILAKREHKLIVLNRILDIEQPTSALIFCRTRDEVDDLTESMLHHHLSPVAIHGGMTQDQRERVMQRFRQGLSNMLVATEIAARGLDISQLSHVVNFDVPQQPEAYVHRTGRVGRAGRKGVAITLVTPTQRMALRQIEREAKIRIEIVPLPTLKAVRAARLDRLRVSLAEAIARADISDETRATLGTLQTEHSAETIALAALQMLLPAADPNDLVELPDLRTATPGKPAARPNSPPRDFPRGDRSERSERAPRRTSRPGMTTLFIGVGREAGVTVRDLVGAITNEAGIPGRDLGSIDLMDRFSLVEVPHEAAEYVIESLQNTRIRGRKAMVRLERPRNGSN